MSKCPICGKNLFLSGHVKLADATICTPCFRSLGFRVLSSDLMDVRNYTLEQVKLGKEGLATHLAKEAIIQDIMSNVTITSSVDPKQVDPNDDELEIFNAIGSILMEEDLPGKLELIRRSYDYVTATVGGLDLVRFKFHPSAKWLMFPCCEAKKVKHYVEEIDEVYDYEDIILYSLGIIRRDLNNERIRQ